MPDVLWFRRDLRLNDHPALQQAAAGDGQVVGLFVVDRVLWEPAGPVRRAALLDALTTLQSDLGGRLVLRHGDPVQVVADLAREVGAGSVHVSADIGPYGTRRDAAVEAALVADGRRLVRTGSAYAVTPGRVRKPDGSAYRIFTPFYKAWLRHGWRSPAGPPAADLEWLAADGEPWPVRPDLDGTLLPPVGEDAALQHWTELLAHGVVDRYPTGRDRPDLDGTTQLSAALRWGTVHPRTLLADLGDGRGADALRRQLAWREFMADVLHHHPQAARVDLNATAHVDTDSGPAADGRFAAWAEGRTGYPFVDAGMRQLRSEGWMHNRLRMVTASFLVKDLHVDWRRGARHFLRWLRDGDLASNQLGWQWVAGTGSDAAPYVRVFNPVTQGLRFDPDGVYVRRHVAELSGLAGASSHEPWAAPGGLPRGYPARIVDHAVERAEALRRHEAATAAWRRARQPAD